MNACYNEETIFINVYLVKIISKVLLLLCLHVCGTSNMFHKLRLLFVWIGLLLHYINVFCNMFVMNMMFGWEMCSCWCNANLVYIYCIMHFPETDQREAEKSSIDGTVGWLWGGGGNQGRIGLDSHYPSISEHLSLSCTH